MRIASIFVFFAILCISFPLVLAEDLVVYDEMPLNFLWAVHEGSDDGTSLKADTSHGGPAENGDFCAKVVYDREEDWASIFITATGDDMRGLGRGLDLTGAKKLIFYAKGVVGDEKITFGYGLGPNELGFSDSSSARRIETLHKDYWQKYEFNLIEKDLSHINGLFLINAEKQYNPMGATFYIDNITYEYPPLPPNISIDSIDNITNPQDGIKVAQAATIIGKCSPDLANSIWVFVVPSITGRYYPQYSCEGLGVTKENGKWEIRIGVGAPNENGNFFDIVVGSANAAANKDLIDTMNSWCEDNNFPGLEKESLPDGVTEVDRIGVIRNAELFGQAPSIPNSYLPGTISINDIENSAIVPPSRLIHGSFSSDMANDIWVLEYASNGRWYPQSIDSCKGISTIKLGDQWQGAMTFGGESGNPFDIIVVSATPEASKILSDFQKSCCENKSYPGLLTVQLPKGLTEKSRIRVYRQ